MARAVNTFYCREALGTTVNPDTIGCVWAGKFDLDMLRVDGEIFKSRKEKLRIQKYPDSLDGALQQKSLISSDFNISNSRQKNVILHINILFGIALHF